MNYNSILVHHYFQYDLIANSSVSLSLLSGQPTCQNRKQTYVVQIMDT